MMIQAKNYKIVITSDKHVLNLSPNSACRLLEGGLIGFDCAGLDVTVRSYASRHGGYPERRRFAERELGITFEICSDSDETEEIRRCIAAIMNPTVTCEIDVEIYGVHRKISAIPCGEVRFERDTMYDRPRVSLEWISPDVFFRAADPEEVIFRDPVPLLTFPLTIWDGAGVSAGIMRTTDSAQIYNDGDTDCGVVATITADGGEIVNPGISCGDEFIICPITLADGDNLVIDTRTGLKNIYLNGVKYFSFDRRSTFFHLPVGENTVGVLCDGGEEYIRAKLSYTPLYYGI